MTKCHEKMNEMIIKMVWIGKTPTFHWHHHRNTAYRFFHAQAATTNSKHAVFRSHIQYKWKSGAISWMNACGKLLFQIRLYKKLVFPFQRRSHRIHWKHSRTELIRNIFASSYSFNNQSGLHANCDPIDFGGFFLCFWHA